MTLKVLEKYIVLKTEKELITSNLSETKVKLNEKSVEKQDLKVKVREDNIQQKKEATNLKYNTEGAKQIINGKSLENESLKVKFYSKEQQKLNKKPEVQI